MTGVDRTPDANQGGHGSVDEPAAKRPPVSAAPETGDATVDGALAGLYESATRGDLDAQAEAGEAVHRALQDRLADLDGG